MKDAPAFDFYPERWLVGVAALSDHEQLSYLRLLCHQWTMDGLPADIPALRRLAGRGVTEVLLEKFPLCDDGKRRNVRLETVRAEQRARISKSRDKIAKMNAARESTRASTRDSTRPLLSASSPLTTHPLENTHTAGATCAVEDDFSPHPQAQRAERIVSAYPRDGGEKMRAIFALLKSVSAGEDIEWIERCVRIHAKKYKELPADQRQFCPGWEKYFTDELWKKNPAEAPWTFFPKTNGNNARPDPSTAKPVNRWAETETTPKA